MDYRSNWRNANIDELCEAIIDCVNRTAPIVSDPTPYKMIRTTNVKSGWIDVQSVRYVTEDVYRRWSRRGELRKGDVILTREAPLGEVGMIRDTDTVFMGQRLIMYRADSTRLDPHFLLYAMQADYLQGQIRAFGSGSTVEHMRVPDAKKLIVFLPPIDIQRTIGRVLSAYDDLIENNTRRIRILEQIIHDLFEEWFISLRFPGYTDRSFASTDFGVLPDQWNWVRFSEAIDVNPKTTVQKDVALPYIPMDRLSESDMQIDTTELEYRPKSSGSKFMNFDTLFARITPCLENGKTGYVQFLPDQGVGIGSTEFVVLRSKSLTSEYVYCLSRRPEFRAAAQKTMTGASGRQRVQNSFFDEYRILQPPQEILEAFQEVVSPMFNQIKVLADKNARLRSCRDLLLPRLISGELDVSHFEPQVDNVEE